MPDNLRVLRMPIPVNRYRTDDPGQNQIYFWWLGQAGFLIRTSSVTCLIDPYLSDALSEKYRGRNFSHKRLMPPPIGYAQLTGINLFFSTHAHSDHLDPQGLGLLAEKNPDCRFVIPASSLAKAIERGVPAERIVPVNSGDMVSSPHGCTVSVLASAHEKLEQDRDGNDFYLGYVFDFDGIRVYHSGDGVPYDGLNRILANSRIDVALLPVNGRDEKRAAQGIPGNFFYCEIVEIMKEAQIPLIIPHHYGMFDFNTIDVRNLENDIRHDGLTSRIVPAYPDTRYSIRY